MKKVFKIILILIVSFLLILVIIWLIGRNRAIKDGKAPLDFRQFLGLSTKKNPSSTIPGEGSSGFGNNNGGNNGGTNSGNGDSNGDGVPDGSDLGGAYTVNVSQFTNSGTSPINTGGNNGNGNNNNGGGTGTIGDPDTIPGDNNGTGDEGVIPFPGTDDGAGQPECSDEDMNIEFTPEQIAQLNILQTRFYALAQTLHPDADVETELANRDAFTLKANSVLGLYAYCQNKIPVINTFADRRMKTHVATPFWKSYGTNPDIAAAVKKHSGITIATTDPIQDYWTFIDIPSLDIGHLQAVHDGNTNNPETGAVIPGLSTALFGNGVLTGNGIRGPYGLLTWSNPELVPTTGSGLDDTQILMPVIEKMLRINLW